MEPNNIRNMVAALTISAVALVGIANKESFRGDAYHDSVKVPTIGYGATKGVKLGQKTTPERALIRLLADVQEHGNFVKACVKVPLYQYEFDAYTSLTYNIGGKAFCKSTLVKKLNEKKYLEACQQILRWDKAGGKTLAGLTKRRNEEYIQCLGESV